MKVVLVQPNYSHQRKYIKYSNHPPLGLAYIAAVLEKNGIETEILDANALNLDINSVIRHIIAVKARIVGVSILMTGYKYSVDLVKEIPENVLSVAGGALPSAIPKEFIKAGYNIVVKGFGEAPMLELAQGKKLEKIDGIYYKDNNKLMQTPARVVKDIYSSLLPARHLLLNNGVDKPYRLEGTMYFPWTPLFTSRGCPYQCCYCSKQVFSGYLPREPEDIISEIDELVTKYNVKEIAINDDCFNANISRAEKILDLIAERNYDLKLRFPNGIRAKGITKVFAEKMKRAGCIQISYGIESGSQKVLDRIPKRNTLENVKQAVEHTKEMGIFTVGFFILGLIGDDEKSMQQTIDFAKKLKLDAAFFSILTPYPGTPLWKIIEEEGEFFIKNLDELHQSSGKIVFSHPAGSSPEVVKRMQKKAYRDFYFSVPYILKQIITLNNWRYFALSLRGLTDIIKTLRRD